MEWLLWFLQWAPTIHSGRGELEITTVNQGTTTASIC